MKFCYNTNFTLPNNPKDLDPSCKMDLDLLDCFGRKKTLSYNRRNRVLFLTQLAHSDPISAHHGNLCGIL